MKVEAAFERIRVTLEGLIAETEGWKTQHGRNGRRIEVMACNIRLKALREFQDHFDKIREQIEL